VHLETYLLAMGIAAVVVGLLHIVLSFLVSRGTTIPIVLGILLCGAMLLLMGLGVIGNLLSGQLPGVCFGGIGVALWGLLLAWLIQAAGRAGQVAAARGYGGYGAQQYAGQYAQYQQQSQQPQQPAPGYGFPPPPPPQQQPSPPSASGYPPPPPPGAGPV
jgi:hypothetical protein